MDNETILEKEDLDHEELEEKDDLRHEKNMGRTFTQQDVNNIVEERLKKYKNKLSRDLETREIELKKRESKLLCKEYLIESGLDVALLDVIETSDFDKFRKGIESVNRIIHKNTKSAPPLRNPESTSSDRVDSSRFDEKHKPKRKYNW